MSSPRSGGGLGPLAIGTVVLAVFVLALTGLTRACSFSPTGPDVDRGSIQRVDVVAATRDAAGTLRFPLRAPALPGGWIPQSSDVRTLPGGRAFRLGWVTPDDSFVRLVQSSAPEAAMVADEQGDPAALGPVSAAGRTWTTYRGLRDEALWVTDAGAGPDGTPVRWLITGSASPTRFTELATTTAATPVFPRG